MHFDLMLSKCSTLQLRMPKTGFCMADICMNNDDDVDDYEYDDWDDDDDDDDDDETNMWLKERPLV